jgi:hypothetical protein
MFQRTLGGGVISAEELFASRGRSASPSPAFRAAAAVSPSPARQAGGGVAALQARLTQLAARAAAETNRRRAAEEGRAAVVEQRDAAMRRAAALEAELQHMHAALTSARDALADAAREVAIKEEECAIMADMCRQAQGLSPGAQHAPQPRSSVAEREAALRAGVGEDGLPVALPMPSGVATHLRHDALGAEAPEYPWRRGER